MSLLESRKPSERRSILERLREENECCIEISQIQKERQILYKLEEEDIEEEKAEELDVLALSIEKVSQIDKELIITAKNE